ncbi:hypothetical protein ACE38V_13805 [Cytobacillus sp. Hz8]|uniref:hypothetical protein n=1 Tax=Cytobacillus sp. Hz8 TaxID=3347168 RepID=UPI0035E1B127
MVRILCILSWVSIAWIPRNEVKRYLPVTILSGLFTVTVVLIGSHYHFWGDKGKAKSKMWNHLSLVLGPFAVTNLWIFHKTYGNLGKYIFVNLLNNLFYGFKVIPIFDKIRFLKYVKFTRIHHIIHTMFESIFLYWYQVFFDKQGNDQIQD